MRKRDQVNVNWFKAMRLWERIKSLRTNGIMGAYDEQLAAGRWQRWRSKEPFNDDKFFADRLAFDGISEAEFRQVLGESAEQLAARYPEVPAWIDWLLTAYEAAPEEFPPRMLQPETPVERRVWGQVDMLNPLIDCAAAQIIARASALKSADPTLPINTDQLSQLFLAGFDWELLRLLGPVLNVKLREWREAKQLQGETPEERFLDFLRQLRQRQTALAILEEYPVMARQVVNDLKLWAANSIRFLERLSADWALIQREFFPTLSDVELGELVETTWAGDFHPHGQVIILKFHNGAQLLYKPHTLSLDAHFYQLLEWVNQAEIVPAFRIIKTIDCGEYGWQEFVSYTECTTLAEVSRFYERQGAYLALFYGLAAMDCHFENIIACGEHPMYIDVEMLFHPNFWEYVNPAKVNESQTVKEWIADKILFRIGLLPSALFHNVESWGFDFSGLAGAAEATQAMGYIYKNRGTDEMEVAFELGQAAVTRLHLPLLNGENVPLLDYVDQITTGFTKMYRFLGAQRQALLAPNGILARFAEDKARLIFRPSMNYEIIMRQVANPNVLRSSIVFDWLLDYLWLPINARPGLWKVIKAEREAMENLMVPLFHACPGKHSVWSGEQEFSAVLPRTGLQTATAFIEEINEVSLARQIWFIRASMAAPAIKDTPPLSPLRLSDLPSQTVWPPEKLLAEIEEIVNRLESLAWTNRQGVTWFGLKPMIPAMKDADKVREALQTGAPWSLTPMDMDLYRGLSGVLLFLVYYEKVTKSTRCADLILRVWFSLQEQMPVNGSQDRITDVGVFGGLGGWLYVLLHLISQPSDTTVGGIQPAVNSLLLPTIERIAHCVEKDEHYDIYSGASGAILALLNCYELTGLPQALQVAIKCGKHLIARAEVFENGIGWPIMKVNPPDKGFVHGVSGSAYALLKLFHFTEDNAFREAFEGTIRYERHLLADIFSGKQPINDISWCNGSTGIGLARLGMLEYQEDPQLYAELAILMESILTRQSFGSHCLCHGGLGLVDFLLQVKEKLIEVDLHHRIDHFIAVVLNSASEHGWVSGLPLPYRIDMIGFMEGISGIGFQLLRLVAPQQVPSPLIVAPPRL